ncbi:MAG: (2Fe-2S)-binding protein [Chloroherpetonaceae bacterium]|nr:(2Fe-2S)-binding protein [Chloroherpetonaceae bacterium]MCS7210347.1 (2Fe-2S)-binding protein [Chloroherpetonaceae bacterium]MDW8019379.1 (2Fe-2S)-binding protein [Chloroherpetonaceae bacterium]MDW8466996.1 (2Fe-2S)-binding protein [Chloroherpetonaceae bacterium]
MKSFTLTVNRQSYTLKLDPDMPLLWVLRDVLGLTGTKYGCGKGYCGACTVLIEGEAAKSCSRPVEMVAGKRITTIEGLAESGLTALQQAWIEEDVAQCGYCQPGQIMTAAGLLNEKPIPTDQDIDEAMSGVLCRCGTYQRIRAAIHRAARLHQKGGLK